MIARLLIPACLILSSAAASAAVSKAPVKKNLHSAKPVTQNGKATEKVSGKVIRSPQHAAKAKTAVNHGRVAQAVNHPPKSAAKKKIPAPRH